MRRPPPAYTPSMTDRSTRFVGCLVVLAFAGFIFILDPRWLSDPLGRLQQAGGSARSRWVLRAVDGPIHDPMSVDLAPDGAVWLTTKYDVSRFVGGDPGKHQTVLDPQIYRDRFGRPMNELASAYLTPDGTMWVGSWSGEVFSYRGGSWSEIISEGAGPVGEIADLVLDDRASEMWIAAFDGLWRAEKASNSLQRIEGMNSTVNALARLAGGVIAAGDLKGVHVGDAGGFRLLWRPSEADRVVGALAATPGGGLLVGTRDGFVELDEAGRELRRELPGRWVTAFAGTPGERLVATWDQGLLVETAAGWRKHGYAEGLPDDNLNDLLIGPGERLWLCIYGRGDARVGDLQDVIELASAGAPPPVLDPASEVFANACDAAAELLPGTAESGQVAVETIAGKTQVFFGGGKVCPRGFGYRRAAGDLLLLNQDALVRITNGKERRLDLPDGVEAEDVSALYLDRRGTAWVGTSGAGLFAGMAGGWRHHGADAELVNHHVRAIVEDWIDGLWVGTSPPSDPETGLDLAPGLHRFDGTAWRHFGGGRRPAAGPADRPQGTTVDLAVLSDQRVAIGTPSGLWIWNGNFQPRVLGTPSFVVSITESPAHRLWLTHGFWGAGVTWLRRVGVGRRTSRDGLFDDRLGDVAFDAQDRIWLLAAASGRVGVYPETAFR